MAGEDERKENGGQGRGKMRELPGNLCWQLQAPVGKLGKYQDQDNGYQDDGN